MKIDIVADNECRRYPLNDTSQTSEFWSGDVVIPARSSAYVTGTTYPCRVIRKVWVEVMSGSGYAGNELMFNTFGIRASDGSHKMLVFGTALGPIGSFGAVSTEDLFEFVLVYSLLYKRFAWFLSIDLELAEKGPRHATV